MLNKNRLASLYAMVAAAIPGVKIFEPGDGDSKFNKTYARLKGVEARLAYEKLLSKFRKSGPMPVMLKPQPRARWHGSRKPRHVHRAT